MNCSNCNQIIPRDSKFCPECGEKVEFMMKSKVIESGDSGGMVAIGSKKPKNTNKVIISLILVGIIILGGFFILKPNNKPHETVYSFFESAMKSNPDKFLDTLSPTLKNELMEEMNWDMMELSYGLNTINEGMMEELGRDWLKKLNINTGYEDGNSAIVDISVAGINASGLKVKLFKQDKKWIIVDFPWWDLPW